MPAPSGKSVLNSTSLIVHHVRFLKSVPCLIMRRKDSLYDAAAADSGASSHNYDRFDLAPGHAGPGYPGFRHGDLYGTSAIPNRRSRPSASVLGSSQPHGFEPAYPAEQPANRRSNHPRKPSCRRP